MHILMYFSGSTGHFTTVAILKHQNNVPFAIIFYNLLLLQQ